MNDKNEKPEATGLIPAGTSARTLAEASKAFSEIQAAVVLAKKYPRDQSVAVKNIVAVCKRPGLAEGAIYEYPRADQKITGASIRLAEAMAREWGNLQYGIVEVERGVGESTVQAYCWDLETNTRAMIEYKVAHVRDTKSGRKDVTDERDIYEVVMNSGARRLRACILKQIPDDVVEQALAECNRTMKAQVGDLQEESRKAIAALGTFGVSKDQIEKRLRHNMEAVSAAEILELRRIFYAIKDGMAKAADYFEISAAPEPVTTPKTTAGRMAQRAATVAKKGRKGQGHASDAAAYAESPADAAMAQETTPAAETDETGIPANI